MEADGQVEVTFPAGALERDQEVTIRKGEAPAGMGTFFFVEFPDSGKELGKTAQVSMKVPAGADVPAVGFGIGHRWAVDADSARCLRLGIEALAARGAHRADGWDGLLT